MQQHNNELLNMVEFSFTTFKIFMINNHILKHIDTKLLICVWFSLIMFFCNNDCTPLIFLIISSFWMSFNCRPTYLWYSKQSVDGWILLYPIDDISVEIWSRCNDLYCSGDNEVYEREWWIFRLRYVDRYNLSGSAWTN